MLRFFISIFLLTSFASANDGFLATFSGNPVPGKSTTIEMCRELIYIKVHREYSEVFCKFWFFNHGKTEKVKVGFPDSESTGFEDATLPLKNFTSIVNGNRIELKPELQLIALDTFDFNINGMKTDTLSFRTWFTKEIEFEGIDTTIIEDYYVAQNSGFFDLMYMGQVFYFIGTGSSWKGPIGHADIIFDHSEAFSNLFINNNFVNDNPKIGYIWKTNYTQLVFDKLVPLDGESVSICFLNFFTSWPETEESKGPFDEYIQYRNLTQKDLYLMREEIKARAGVPDNEVYKDCEWYNSAQSENKGVLNESEQTAIKELDRQLRKFRGGIFATSVPNPCSSLQSEKKRLERWKNQFEIVKFIEK